MSVVYLPQQFSRLRQEVNQTVEQKLNSQNSEFKKGLNEFNQRLSSIEDKIGHLGFLENTVDLEKLKKQEEVLELKLESLKNEIAAHQATIQNLTKTISEYEDTIANLDWKKRQLDKAVKEAQDQVNQ
jgi:chromosome segregation ATPase